MLVWIMIQSFRMAQDFARRYIGTYIVSNASMGNGKCVVELALFKSIDQRNYCLCLFFS